MLIWIKIFKIRYIQKHVFRRKINIQTINQKYGLKSNKFRVKSKVAIFPLNINIKQCNKKWEEILHRIYLDYLLNC
jgi:hypothetical protein